MTVWLLSCLDTAVSSGISRSYHTKSFHNFICAAACTNDHTAAVKVLAATNHPKSMAPYDAGKKRRFTPRLSHMGVLNIIMIYAMQTPRERKPPPVLVWGAWCSLTRLESLSTICPPMVINCSQCHLRPIVECHVNRFIRFTQCC